MPNERVLVVDDEEDILELVRYNLAKDGYSVSTTTSGEDAVTRVRSEKPDLILLDLMLPGMNGLDVCRILKNDASTVSIPILMITALGEEADIVAGLELGAADYVTKPFSTRVLLARVRAVLRRSSGEPTSKNGDGRLSAEKLLIDTKRHEVTLDERVLELTATEFRLLHFLASHRGWVYTRSQIVDAVHGEDYPVTDRSVDVQIAGLRKKLGDEGTYIETIRGVGYRFKE